MTPTLLHESSAGSFSGVFGVHAPLALFVFLDWVELGSGVSKFFVMVIPPPVKFLFLEYCVTISKGK
jgi:hypothetical protein